MDMNIQRLIYRGLWLRGLIFVFSLVAIATQTSYGQAIEDPLHAAYTYLLANVVEEADEHTGFIEAAMEALTYYLSHPIDLNTCAYSELESFPLLDPATAKHIIELRQTKGAMKSFSDVLEIKSISWAFLQLLRPFFRLSPPEPTPVAQKPLAQTRKRVTVLSQSFKRRVELPRGYSRPSEQGGFFGRPLAMYTRFTSDSKFGWSVRLTTEKDPGEAIAWNPSKRIYFTDHLSFALYLKDRSILKQVIIGDYFVQFGQGLLFAHPFSSSKGSSPTRSPIRPFYNIRPGVSRSEGFSYRGLVMHLNTPRSLDAFVFVSHRKRDATINRYGPDSLMGVSALPTSGLHRTESEIQKKARLKETLAAATLAANIQSLRLGASTFCATYSLPFLSTDSTLPSELEFTGKQSCGWSLFSNVQTGHLESSIEVAKTIPGSFAVLASTQIQKPGSLRMLLLWRWYAPRFFSLFGSGFGERSTQTKNETGLYIGSSFRITNRWKGSFFLDIYEFRHLSSPPSKKPYPGIEGFGSLSYSPRTWLTLRFWHRMEAAYTSTTHQNSHLHYMHSVAPTLKQQYAFRIDFIHASAFMLRTHIEARQSHFMNVIHRGFLFYNDFTFYPLKSTKIYLRFSIFESNSNDTILYAFERDLRFTYGIRSFSGKGLRNVVLIRHSLLENVFVEFKYAQTRHPFSILKGSGNDAITSDRLTEVSGQVIWRI